MQNTEALRSKGPVRPDLGRENGRIERSRRVQDHLAGPRAIIITRLMPEPKRSPRRRPNTLAEPTAPLAASRAIAKRATKAAAIRAPKPVDHDTLVEIFRRFRDADPEPRGSSNIPIPTRCWSPWRSPRRRPTWASTRRPAACLPWPTRRRRCWPWARKGCAQHIRTLNFFNTKARNVIALAASAWSTSSAARCRDSVEILETLPGVGRKTASVVVNVAFGIPRIAVDTHIFRVTNRIPLAVTRTPLETQVALEARIAAAVPPPRPSLADPARPLHLQGAQARMLALPDRRPLPLPRQDRLGPEGPQPKTMRPARPAEPTTIRHQAKGVKPWRDT